MDVDGADGSGRPAEDDRVLQELDLYFTPELSAALTLLQFPQRPVPIRRAADETPNAHPLLPESISTDEAAAAIKARLKPSTNTLELSIPLENPSEGRLRRQALADYGEVLSAHDLNASSELASASNKRRQLMDKPPLEAMVLRGQGLPDQTNYCAMVLIGDRAHLTPLNSTVQLRPHQTYLDRMANRPKVDKEDGNNSDANASDPDEDETAFDRRKKEHLTKQAAAAAEPKAVVVTVKDPAANAAKNAARNQGSLLTPARAEEIELWKGLEFADSTTARARAISARLLLGHGADPLEGTLDNTKHIRLPAAVAPSAMPMKPV